MNGMDLVTFLRARLNEDEANARSGFPAEPHSIVCGYDQIEFSQGCDCTVRARVLADVAAKRAILEMFIRPDALDPETRTWLDVLRHLATPYTDHPDYDQTWRP